MKNQMLVDENVVSERSEVPLLFSSLLDLFLSRSLSLSLSLSLPLILYISLYLSPLFRSLYLTISLSLSLPPLVIAKNENKEWHAMALQHTGNS